MGGINDEYREKFKRSKFDKIEQIERALECSKNSFSQRL
jgi:hypothetical protein